MTFKCRERGHNRKKNWTQTYDTDTFRYHSSRVKVNQKSKTPEWTKSRMQKILKRTITVVLKTKKYYYYGGETTKSVTSWEATVTLADRCLKVCNHTNLSAVIHCIAWVWWTWNDQHQLSSTHNEVKLCLAWKRTAKVQKWDTSWSKHKHTGR